jgi:hypothetical protein
LIVLALAGVWLCWRREPHGVADAGNLRLAERMRRSPAFEAQILLSLYLLTTTLSWLGQAKSGSASNYVIEWMCVLSIWVGVLVARIVALAMLLLAPATDRQGLSARKILAPGVVALLLVQALLTRSIDFPDLREPETRTGWQHLVERIRASPLPVLSDDMVLLRRAGKDVPWEPFMFTELTRLGRWDERQIVEMISRRAFGFVITTGRHGDSLYDSRYTEAVNRAIEQAYPAVTTVNNMLVRAPAE